MLEQETKKSTENITRIVETLLPSSESERDRARKYKSTQSLHELGLDNYPNPEYPESTRLSRKEEKQSLQNLNNRLASKSSRTWTIGLLVSHPDQLILKRKNVIDYSRSLFVCFSSFQMINRQGRDCGSVGRAVASNTSGLWFESSHG